MRQIDESWNGRQLELSVGQRFEVSLAENPTTGFRWNFESNGGPVCALASDSFVPSAGPPGAGGFHRWEFEAMREGHADLCLAYRRPWGHASVPAKTFTLHLLVAR